MVTVRELVTTWGFEVDDAPLKRLDKDLQRLKFSAKAVGVVAISAASSVGFLLNEAGKQEKTRVAFETLLGSMEKADTLIRDLFDFATKTPFLIPDVEKNAKLLLAMGIEVEKLLPTMKALGDVSAGLNVPLERIALNFGQVRNQSKLTGRELRDFAVAGVPLLDELANNLGKSNKQIQEMISSGKIGFPEVEKAFMTMTSEGGRFQDLMIKMAKTLPGLISNVIVTLQIMAREIGSELLPAAKEIVEEVFNWLRANDKLIKQNTIKFVKILSRFMIDLFKILKLTVSILGTFSRFLGGAERAIKTLTFSLLALFSVNLLSIVGSLVLNVLSLTQAFITLGGSVLFAKLAILALPLAIGALIASFALLVEDFIAFWKGDDSVIGQWVQAFRTATEIIPKLWRGMLDEMKKDVIGFFSDSKIIKFAKFGADPFGSIANLSSDILGNISSDLFSAARQRITGGATSTNNVSVNSPINVNVPDGTNPESVGPAVQAGISDGISRVLRETFNANQPVFVQ